YIADRIKALGLRIDRQTETMRIAGAVPGPVDELRRTGDADHVEFPQMLLEAICDVGRDEFDVIVAEDDIFAAGPEEAARIALAQRTCVRNMNELVRAIPKDGLVVSANNRRPLGSMTADDR